MREAKHRCSDPSRQRKEQRGRAEGRAGKRAESGREKRKEEEQSGRKKSRAEGRRKSRAEGRRKSKRVKKANKSKIAIESRWLPPPRVTPGEGENVNAGALLPVP